MILMRLGKLSRARHTQDHQYCHPKHPWRDRLVQKGSFVLELVPAFTSLEPSRRSI